MTLPSNLRARSEQPLFGSSNIQNALSKLTCSHWRRNTERLPYPLRLHASAMAVQREAVSVALAAIAAALVLLCTSQCAGFDACIVSAVTQLHLHQQRKLRLLRKKKLLLMLHRRRCLLLFSPPAP